MSRILLLMLFLIWLAWSPRQGAVYDGPAWVAVVCFLGVYAMLVLVMGLWARLMARNVTGGNLRRKLRSFNAVMQGARIFIPVWFAIGVFVFGWGYVLGALRATPYEVPSLLVGTLPGVLAWMGLWWSQFPADRALREQSLLVQFDANLPVYAPPGFGKYFRSHLRLQLLFTLVPVLMILALRDIGVAIASMFNVSRDAAVHVEAAIMLGSTATVFLLAPEILRRILHCRPLPDSPIRRRLEALCRQTHLRYRDVLLWHTDNNTGNAAVMGLVPRWRYILLSDLLLETMTDEQIEAVFAHEIGHIVHRHMAWYLVFFIILLLAAAGPGMLLQRQIESVGIPIEWTEVMILALGVVIFLLAFGFLSRRFERQADVFAARTVQKNVQSSPVDHVGEHGARVFASALERVAVVNNIPIAARNWSHGSIEKRMQFLRSMGQDPALTKRFDGGMLRLYLGMLALLLILAGMAVQVAM